MALVLRSTSTSTSAASGLTITIPVPSGLTVGDLMIAYVMWNANGGATVVTAPDATWLLIDWEHRAGITHAIFYKLATSSDVAASSFTPFTIAVGGPNIGRIYAFSSGYDPTYPIAWNIGGTTDAAGTNIIPSMTDYQTNAYICQCWSGSALNYNPMSALAIATSDPGGWTNQGGFGDATSVANGALWISNQRTQITDTGQATATATTNRGNATTMFAILPSQVLTTIADYYPEGEGQISQIITGTSTDGRGQAFNSGGGVLSSVSFYIKKNSAPTGNINATIYNTTGTYGSTMTTTGAAIATSDNFDVSTLSTSYALVTFTFSGGNKITLTGGTKYIVALETTGVGDGTNNISILADSTGYRLHPGNTVSRTSGGSYVAVASVDTPFYITTASAVTTNKTITVTQSGVASVVINRYYQNNIIASTSTSAFRINSALKPLIPLLKTTPDNATFYSKEVLADNPVSYFRMNALVGSGEADVGSLNNTATYWNNPTLGVPGAIASSDTAVKFTGNGGTANQKYMVIPDSDQYSFITNRALTIECFVTFGGKPPPGGYSPTVLSKNVLSPTGNEYDFTYVFGAPRFTVYNTSGTLNKTVIGNTPTSGTFHHYVATIQDSAGILNLNLYQDGVNVATNTWVSDFLVNGPGKIYVGGAQADPAGNSNVFDNLNGIVDELAIYNYALTPSRITAHYNALNSAQNQTAAVKAITNARKISQAQSLSPLKQCARAFRATAITVAVVLRSFLYSRILAVTVSTVNTTVSKALTWTRIITATVTTTATALTKQCRRGISSSATTTPIVIKQIGKLISSSVTSLGFSPTKQVGKLILLIVTSTGLSPIKQVGKILLAPVATAATTAQKQCQRALTALVGSTPNVIKQIGKFIPSLVTSTGVNITKQCGKLLKSPVTTVVTLVKSLTFSRVLTATVTTLTTLQKQIQKNILSIVSSVITVIKQGNKSLLATVATTSSTIKQAGKACSSIVITSVSAIKLISKFISYTQASAVASLHGFTHLVSLIATVITGGTLVKQVNKNVNPVVITLVSRLKQAGKNCIPVVTTVVSPLKAITKSTSLVTGTTVSVVKRVGKVFQIGSTSLVSLTKQINKLLTAVVITTGSISRQFGKSCSAIVITTTTAIKQTGRTISGRVSTITTGTRDYGIEVLADKPVSYWRMDALSGVTETDLGSLANNGTYINSPSLGVTGALTYDSAVSFKASSAQTMSAPDNDQYSILTNNALTVECFAKIGGVPQTIPPTLLINFLTKGKSAQHEWGWQLQATGNAIFQVWNAAGTTLRSVSAGVQASGTYHHYVATIQDNAGTSTLSVYTDGIFQSSGTFTTASTANNTAAIRVGGRDDTTNFFDGVVDEVAIYNYALSPSRIAVHAAAINSNQTSAQKGVNKTVVFSQASSGNVIKQIAKLMPGVVVTTSVACLKGFQKIVGATVSTPSSLIKSVFKIRLVTAITLTTPQKSVGRIITSSQATVASAIKLTQKTISLTTGTSTSYLRGFQKILSAAVSTSSSLSKSVFKILLATVVTVVSVQKGAARVISVTQATSASAIKLINKNIGSIITSTTVACGRGYFRVLNAIVSSTTTLPRSIFKNIIPVVTIVYTIPRAITRGAFIITQAGTAFCIKQVNKLPFVATVTTITSESFTASNFIHFINYTVVTPTTVTLNKFVTKAINMYQTGNYGEWWYGIHVPIVSLTNSITKSITPIIVTTVVSPVKSILKLIYLFSYSGQVLVDSPRAYYRLGDRSGSALDSSGNGNNLTTIIGTPRYNTPGLLTRDADAAVTVGNPTGAFGSTTYAPTTFPITLETWITHSSGITQRIVSCGGGGLGGWSWGLNSSNNVRFTTHGVKDYDFTAQGLLLGTTYHIVTVFRPDFSCSAWANNVFLGTLTFGSGPVATTSHLQIGQQGNGEPFIGVIDEVAVYNYELSPAQIAAHYTAGTNPSAVISTVTLARFIGKSILATVTTVPSRLKQIGKGLVASSITGTTLAKQVNKIVSSVVTTGVVISNGTRRILLAVVSTTQDLFGQGNFGFGNFGTGTILLKQVNKNIISTCSTVVSRSRQMARILLATSITVATPIKKITKFISVTAITNAIRLNGVRRILLSGVIARTTILKQVNKNILSICSTVVTRSRQFGRILLASGSTVTKVTKQVGKNIKPISLTVGLITKKGMKVNTSSVTTTTTLSRLVGKRILANCVVLVSTTKNISNRIFRVTVNTPIILRKTIFKSLIDSIITTVTLPTPGIIRTAQVIFRMVGFTRITRHFKTVSSQQAPNLTGRTRVNPVEGDIDANVVGNVKLNPIEGDDDSTFIDKSNS